MAPQLHAIGLVPDWRAASPEPVRFAVPDLDPSIRPQDDLDGFVNARWRLAHPVPDGHSCWDTFAILHERSLRQQAALADAAARGELGDAPAARIVGDLWSSGMDDRSAVRGRSTLADEFARIDAVGDRGALIAYLHRSHANGGDALYRIDARPDYDEPSRQLAFVSPREPLLRDPATFEDRSEAAVRLRASYVDYGASLLALSGMPGSAALMDAVFAVERELAGALPSRRAAREVAVAFNPLDAAGATRLAPTFDWSGFLAANGAGTDRFSLSTPAYHAVVERLLQHLPLPVWRALLRLRAAADAAAFLDAPWRAVDDRFHCALRGRRGALPPWKHVVAAIDAHAGEALGRLFAERHGSATSNERARALFETLRTAFAARVRRLDWLGAATRARALDKLARMTAKFGSPARWPALDVFATCAGDLYANVVSARAARRHATLRRCGGATDPHAWSLTPQTVNARYDPQRNEIVVPAALLQPPFLAADGDAASLYGGLGAVVAHEMTHALDDQGSRFDASGRLRDWWTGDDRARFATLANRLSEVAGAWTCLYGEPVDGRLTLGENIADFGGLAVAWDAFEATAGGPDAPPRGGFTARQRFFLHWATLWRQNLSPDERRLRARIDVHAPTNVRVNAAAADLRGFAEAFGCVDGDGMMRRERVGIW